MKSRLPGAVCACIFSFLSTATPAALVDNGGGFIYDDVLDITWAQPNGILKPSWFAARDWAAGLTLGGVSGWRLPYISVKVGAGTLTTNTVDCSAATELACRDNELGYMFYQNLGGTEGSSILTSGDPDLALFPTLRSNIYWSGTEFVSLVVWSFGFQYGYQDGSAKSSDFPYSWAVHAGNVSASVVPIPAAVWLFGSGLLGLTGILRRKKSA